MEQKLYSFNVKFENFEKINSQFAKVKVYVLYTGENRNRTYMSKDVIEQALYSLRNIPVVGEWKEENKNFGGHGGKIEISDDGIQWIETTKPYGVVPSDTEIAWETVREKDGITEHEYLTCTAYLWYKRYPEIEKVLNDGANQSMEIIVPQYHYNEKDYAVFDEIEFSALCILGKDSDPEKNVEPCFEGAKITNYALDKDKFKQEFTTMLQELKFSLQNQSSNEVDNINETEEGGSEVEDNKDFTTETDETEVDNATTDFEENVNADNPTEESNEDFTNETSEVDSNNENSEEVEEEAEVDNADSDQNYNLLKSQYDELNEKFNNLESDFDKLQSKYDELKAENESLTEFKINRDKALRKDVFAKFTDLTTEDVQDLYDNMLNYSVAELEEKLFAIWGKKKMAVEKGNKENFSRNEGTPNHLVFGLGEDVQNPNEPVYVDIIKKHIKRN